MIGRFLSKERAKIIKKARLEQALTSSKNKKSEPIVKTKGEVESRPKVSI